MNNEEKIKIEEEFIFIISGGVASGKSSIGELFKKRLLRTAVFDMDDIKWQISDFKKGDEDNLIVRKGVYVLAKSYLENNISVIIPQTFEKYDLEWFQKIAKEMNINLIQIELFANKDVTLERYYSRKKINQSPKERVLRNIEWYEKNKSKNPNVLKIDTSDLKLNDVFDIVFKYFIEEIKK